MRDDLPWWYVWYEASLLERWIMTLAVYAVLVNVILLSGCRTIWGTTDSDWKYHRQGEWPVGAVLQSGVTPWD